MVWIILLTTSLTLSFIFMILGLVLSKIFLSYREFISPLECGFNSSSELRSPVSLRFFIFAVIFVIFDIELILVIPALTLNSNILYSLGFYFWVVNLLTLGLLIEWNNKAFNWLV